MGMRKRQGTTSPTPPSKAAGDNTWSPATVSWTASCCYAPALPRWTRDVEEGDVVQSTVVGAGKNHWCAP